MFNIILGLEKGKNQSFFTKVDVLSIVSKKLDGECFLKYGFDTFKFSALSTHGSEKMRRSVVFCAHGVCRDPLPMVSPNQEIVTRSGDKMKQLPLHLSLDGETSPDQEIVSRLVNLS